MTTNRHPSDLNPLQRFRQARSLLRHTSRAKNPAWYQSALEMDFQLHLRSDGNRFESWVHDRRANTWMAGPSLTDTHATDLSIAPSFASEIIDLAARSKVGAIGIIFHLADEFATSELKPELDNPGALSELRDAIKTDPKSVLDDSSVSAADSSWRLIPYPAAGSEAIATSITVSRTWAPFLDELRKAGEDANFPIITCAVSAPLICLLALPDLKQDELTRPLITVLSYPRFTLLAFFNEHGDLRLLRTLQHRGQRRPTNLRHAASTTAAALELADPEVYLLATGQVIDPQMVADLQLVFPAASIREIDWTGTRHAASSTGGMSPEPLIASTTGNDTETPLASSHTFSVLRQDGWATQDFLPVAKELAEVYPNRGEMKLLRAARHASLTFAALTLLGLAFFGYQMVDMVRKPEWGFDSASAKLQKQRLAIMTAEQGKLDHWDNLLEDRSKAWAAMELLSVMFPQKREFLIKTFQHTASPQSTPGQIKAGFTREWKITGLAGESSLEHLASLNTRDGISAVFDQVARQTGNGSFLTDLPSRSLVVNVRTQENSASRSGPSGGSGELPYSFDLTITQRFESSDQLALTTAKAP